MKRFALAALFLALAAESALAQHPFATGGSYDPAVPAPRAVLGYEVGDTIICMITGE